MLFPCHGESNGKENGRLNGVQDQEDASVMIFCTVVASILVAVILLAAVYSAAQFVRSKLQKQLGCS